jgi:hypothetical protein
LHQRSFAEALVQKYQPGTGRAAAMPYLTTKEKVIPQDVEAASESAQFEYMCMIGDLTWYSRTNPGIAWRAADLARHMQNPAPNHIEAAKYVMRYIADNLDAGLTYHGSKSVLSKATTTRTRSSPWWMQASGTKETLTRPVQLSS